MANGRILYDGPSVLDGCPIVVIATKGTRNEKTGDMIQTWILKKFINPVTAVQDGSDSTVCGDCPLRPYNHAPGTCSGGCYVVVANAPLAVWRAWRRGGYEPADADWLLGGIVRIGSYGDPAAVPVSVWSELARHVHSWTGYTHLWRTADPALQYYCMASVESPEASREAHALGWRTFRIAEHADPIGGEVVCLSESDGVTCRSCRLCSGNRNGFAPDVVISAHGSGVKRAVAVTAAE